MIVEAIASDRVCAAQSCPTRQSWEGKSSARRRRLRFQVFQRDDWRCTYCGQDLLLHLDTLLAATVDHVQPLCEGGTSELDNLTTACNVCNSLKAGTRTMTIAQARKVVLERRKALVIRAITELDVLGVHLPDGILRRARRSWLDRLLGR